MLLERERVLDDIERTVNSVSNFYLELANYLYILDLMISCKEAAVRLSTQVWKGIEARILTTRYLK